LIGGIGRISSEERLSAEDGLAANRNSPRARSAVANYSRDVALDTALIARRDQKALGAALRFAERLQERVEKSILPRSAFRTNPFAVPWETITAEHQSNPNIATTLIGNRQSLSSKLIIAGEITPALEARLVVLIHASGLFDRRIYKAGDIDPSTCVAAIAALREAGVAAAEEDARAIVHYLRAGDAQAEVSTIFDAAHYLSNAEGRSGALDWLLNVPLAHYLLVGARELLAPHPLFSPRYYVDQLPLALRRLVDPIVHYRTLGWRLGLDPHWAFSVGFYLRRYPDILGAEIDAWGHYVAAGDLEGRDPHYLFSNLHYRKVSGVQPVRSSDVLIHFLTQGIKRKLQPSPIFDVRHYISQIKGATPEPTNWFLHFINNGMAEPNRFFDASFYLMSNPDVLNAGFHAFAHYVNFGFHEGRDPSALFNIRFYQDSVGVPTGEEPLNHYLRTPGPMRKPALPLFDEKHYAATYSDLKNVKSSLFDHFCIFGAKTGRSPSPWFDARTYALRAQRPPDSDLFIHYLKIGSKTRVSPHPLFDAQAYADAHTLGPDEDPLTHFVRSGCPKEWSRGPDRTASYDALHEVAGWRKVPGRVEWRIDRPIIMVVAHAVSKVIFGGERSFIDILRGLSANNYNVVAVLPGQIEAYTREVALHAQAVFEGHFPRWRADTAIADQAISRFRALFLSQPVDAVHINTLMLREPMIAATSLGIPALVHVRELVDEDPYLCKVMGASPDEIKAFVRVNSARIIANSTATRLAFSKDDDVVTVRNTLDFANFEVPPPPSEGQIGALRVGLISSNIEKKGVADLFQLAAAMLERAPQVKFVVIGPETDHLSALLKTAHANGQAGNLEYAGYVERPEDAMAQLDVVVNFSHFAESFGRTVLEGLASGRPAVVYRYGALPELVEDGVTGYIIPYRRPEAAIEPILQLAASPELRRRMSVAAIDNARKTYDLPAYAASLAEAYAPFLRGLKAPNLRTVWPESDPKPAPLPAPAPFKPISSALPATIANPMAAADDAVRALSGRSAAEIEVAEILPQRRFLAKSQRTRKRIAYFQWHFPVPSETFVLNELRALVAAGDDVIVFCRHSPHKDFAPDFPIHWETVDTPQTLARRLRETNREIVHSHFTYPTVTDMVWPAAREAGLKFTFNAHAQDIFRHGNDEKNRIGEVVSAPECLGVLVPGRFHREFLLQRGVPGDKILIRPQAVDVSRYLVEGRSGAPDRSRRRIGAIHRFAEKKGLHHLLRAARRLEQDGIDIALWGYGDMEEEYRRIIAEEGVRNVTIHSGYVDHDAILRAFSELDLFLCPSVRAADGDMDGIPTVVMEAMAFGLPVLTTQVSSLPELIQDGVTGFTCEAGDPASIADAVSRFYATPTIEIEHMVARAREKVRTNYAVDRLVRVLHRVWSDEPIDLVIVSWNNLPELQEIVRRLYAYTSLPFHLTICDNDSQPDVVDYLERLQRERDNVTFLKKGWNSMVGPGTNSAMGAGDGDVIVYICGKEGFVTNFGWEESIIHYMAEHAAIGLAGTLCYSPSYLFGKDYPNAIALWDKFRNQAFAHQNPDRQFGHAQGGFFAMRRAMIDKIGGFSRDVPHNYTDVEFSYYVESCGYELGVLPNLLALFNKTRPDIRSRFDENVLACHPPMLSDGPWLDALAHEGHKGCNICGWHGESYAAAAGEQHSCPACNAGPFDRTLWRALAESRLMYRRLPALGVNIPEAFAAEWTKSFQGAVMPELDFRQTIARDGKLENKSEGMRFIAANAMRSQSGTAWITMAGEWARLLHPEGEMWVLGACGADDEESRRMRAPAKATIVDALAAVGFNVVEAAPYAARTIRFAPYPMFMCTKRN
jgi:glycosyltransferase involved in cell wall biosynthesis/GT2 family glycosyltransferase